MILAGLAAIAGEIVGGVRDHFAGKRELKKAEVENRARLLRDKASNNHEWEMANLQDKDKILRWISFCMFTWPFIWIYFDPAASAQYFEILDETMPAWYKQTYMGMTGGIWGLSSLKNVVPSLVNGVKNAIKK
jgi:hypothetical protein